MQRSIGVHLFIGSCAGFSLLGPVCPGCMPKVLLMNIKSAQVWIIALVAGLLFVPGLGGVHLFDWDEVNFAEVSREMLSTDDFLLVQINFLPFWEKPPLFFWMQVLSMAVFGISDFAARFPNAVCGTLTLPLLFVVGKRLYDNRFGILWAGAYGGSVLPFLYFKSGIIDPWFNLFIFTGLIAFIAFYWKHSGIGALDTGRPAWVYLVAAGLLVGLGVLTKGPVALLIAGLTMVVYWAGQRFKWYVGLRHFAAFAALSLLATLIWYAAVIQRDGPGTIVAFNDYQVRLLTTPDAGHKGFPGFHAVVLLLGCFPASVFALRGLWRLPGVDTPAQADFRRWMLMLFWVVLLLFSLVQSKIVHYSSMCYFPLTYLGALVVYRILRGELSFRPWMQGLLVFIGGLYVMVTLGLPLVMPYAGQLKNRLKDPFAQAALEAPVTWTGMEGAPGVWLILLLSWFFWTYHEGRKARAMSLLFGGTSVFVLGTLYMFIGRIEAYSQRAAIDFFKAHAGQDVYMVTHGYKSYAHLYYGRQPAHTHPSRTDKNWLLAGDTDKDVLLSAKINKVPQLADYPELMEIGRSSGFVFFRRSAKTTGFLRDQPKIGN